MSYGTSTTRYLENDVLSRSPEWLVPLLYEHLLASLNRAAVCIETRNLEEKGVALTKATDIVLQLASSLDAEQGGELAKQLGSMYAFFAGEILEISRSLDTGRLTRLSGLIAELHEAWVQAAQQVAPRGGRTHLLAASA